MNEPTAYRILVVEDDPKTAASVALYLRHEGYDVTTARDGTRGLELAENGGHDLLILDLMLPGTDGLEICRAVRRDSRIPVILLTARSTEADRVRGLDLGADDYVVKPFSPRELMARVRAVLRRSPAGDGGEEVLRHGELVVNVTRHEVSLAGKSVALTPTEFRLLHALARAPSRVLTREELVGAAFGADYRGLDRTVDVHVKNLRRKIEPDRSRPSLIRTIFGVGYAFGGQERIE